MDPDGLISCLKNYVGIIDVSSVTQMPPPFVLLYFVGCPKDLFWVLSCLPFTHYPWVKTCIYMTLIFIAMQMTPNWMSWLSWHHECILYCVLPFCNKNCMAKKKNTAIELRDFNYPLLPKYWNCATLLCETDKANQDQVIPSQKFIRAFFLPQTWKQNAAARLLIEKRPHDTKPCCPSSVTCEFWNRF